MSLLITVVIWLVIVASLVWAESYLPFDGRIVQIIQAVTAIVGVLLLAQKVLV